jgi:hypothetical protein
MGKPLNPIDGGVPAIDAGTSARVAHSPPVPKGTELVDAGVGISTGKGLSFELNDAPAMSIPIPLGNVTEDEARAAAWVYSHLGEIIAAEKKFQVDRRAIAGAIMWEALENPARFGLRAVGPAKVHVYAAKLPGTSFVYGEDSVIAKKVEDLGYLPKQATVGDRSKILATASGGIEYTAAIMRAYVDVSRNRGYAVQCDPVVLTHCFQGTGQKYSTAGDLENWDKLLESKKGAPLDPRNEMAMWVRGHLPLIEELVGGPQIPCG